MPKSSSLAPVETHVQEREETEQTNAMGCGISTEGHLDPEHSKELWELAEATKKIKVH